MRRFPVWFFLTTALISSAHALDRPWIADTYFYWYTWNYEQELGGWVGGVYNTPLRGYYDSPRYEDNLTGLRHASEWGLTHHFMDYWGPGWQGEDGGPREAVLMRATEALQRDGYDVWMSVYQDGTDFDMAQFSRNLNPGRDTEFYVQRYAQSPANPLMNGKPVYLIYGRNGTPQVTGTDEGFRDWLRAKYGSIKALNRRWEVRLANFADVRFDPGAKGHLRADSIKYQYQVWADEMARANGAARDRFGLPGVVFSWDVGFQPFLGWGYSDQMRVFGGPHSYGGIFGVPHQEDVERFIQAAVAKRYGTIFFDTFKNFYHDWEIRIPGICYPPDFAAFDRFWVQALSHYSEALLHLSWNEWWEGSNLEPCEEYGKTYGEKNLLYASIMKQCFPSIQKWSQGARVAVLLNDWHWLAGGRHPEDIYACVQALRQANIRFDLLPDDFVTAQELSRFAVVVAPAAGVGFGYNAQDESIADLLLAWAEGSGRKLIVDDYPGLADRLKLQLSPTEAAQAAKPGPDMNVFVDIGEEGDDKFLIEGASGREDWGKLPPGKFGATSGKLTVRWMPASGKTTTFMLPLSPHRDHVLRLAGSTLRGNQVTVLVDGVPAAEFALAAGPNECEVKIPATAVGGRAQAEVTLQYATAIIPKEIDPKSYDYESRVCNLALDWLQLATAGTPLSREQNYKLPEAGVKFGPTAPGWLKGKTITGPYVRHLPLARTPGTLSTYVTDGTARDLATGARGNILYVNGLLSGLETKSYLSSLLIDWAELQPELRNRSEEVMVTKLQAGNTDILLAYNYAAPEEHQFAPFPPQIMGRPPVVELRCLSKDGSMPAKPDLTVKAAEIKTSLLERVKYYGVYQATRGWVRLTTPALALATGEVQTVRLSLEGADLGLPARTVDGKVSLISHLPSLTSDTVTFRVERGAKVEVPLTITCRQDADWGKKTVIFDVEVEGQHSYFWRTLTVLRPPDVQVTSAVVDAGSPAVTVAAITRDWAQDAAARNVRLHLPEGRSVAIGDLAAKTAQQVSLEVSSRVTEPELEQVSAALEYDYGNMHASRPVALQVARYPDNYPRARDAVAPVIVANPHDEYLENCIVSAPLGGIMLGGQPAYVRERSGSVVPSQVIGASIYWIAMQPPQSATLYYLCAGETPQPVTDLTVRAEGGKTMLGNSRLTLEWDGTRGGTLTRLVSAASGTDYAAGSCGGGWGTWGKYDPLAPAINAVNFVSQERKTWQRDSSEPAEIRILRAGPVLAEVEIRGRAGAAWCTQTYTLAAYQGDFRVVGAIQTRTPTEELVPLDIRLARQGLTKIFPNFTGIAEGFTGDQPHAGWREAPYTPPYATMMAPDAYTESLSVLPEAYGHLPSAKFRQGFWPERRPEAGPVDYAEIEFCTTGDRRATAAARVLLHPGHQVIAKAFRQTHMDTPPVIILPQGFRWKGEVVATASTAPSEWWNPYWHYALPVTVGPIAAEIAGPQVVLRPDFQRLLEGQELDPASPRAVTRTGAGFFELPTAYEPETGEVTVNLTDSAWGSPTPARRQFTLYFDAVANGPKRVVRQVRPQARVLLDGSFEGTEYWSLGGGASLDTTQARTGRQSARLEWKADMGPVVVTNDTFRLQPNATYRVSFWARTESPGAVVRSNFYSGATYDFPQVGTALTPDGQWHRYEQVLPTESFPWGVRPGLRFWVLDHPQLVWLDDIEVQAIVIAPTSELPIQFGEILVR